MKRRVSFDRVCDSVCCKFRFFAGRVEFKEKRSIV